MTAGDELEHGMRRRAAGFVLLGAGLAMVACAGPGSDADPAAPEPVPYADTLPIREPGVQEHGRVAEFLKVTLRDEIGRPLSLRRALSGGDEALNVTSRDEVVPSAWFEPRIGAEEMSPEAVAAGPPGADPDTTAPLRVVGAKVGGVSPGFTVRDRKGDTYLLKFDPVGHPDLASGADVVSSRIFWAAGYHVPRDVVITIRLDELEVDDGATVETMRGERPMRREDVRRVLTSTDSLADGGYRALASLFVPGTPKGPFRFKGTRRDDPNDYYRHEDRRELRGVWALAAWTGHVDLRFENTLDVWIDPPGYLRHYIIDFGATLGSRSVTGANAREGREYAFDLWPSLGRVATLGLFQMGWEGIDDTEIHPSIGWIATGSFEPGSWKPFWPNDGFRSMTVRDAYWGAKLVAAFGRGHLEAVVAEARYRDPVAADTLVEILETRQRSVVRHWYSRVTPMESVVIDGAPGDSLIVRFDDLGLAEGLWSAGDTRYRWRLETPGGDHWRGEIQAVPGRRQALTVAGAPGAPGISTLKITAVRTRAGAPPSGGPRPATLRIAPAGSGYRIVRLTH